MLGERKGGEEIDSDVECAEIKGTGPQRTALSSGNAKRGRVDGYGRVDRLDRDENNRMFYTCWIYLAFPSKFQLE